MRREILFLIAIIIVSGCAMYIESNNNDENNSDTNNTIIDNDTLVCVPATCCHPTQCVPESQAPNCSDIFCTQECQPGTMDCGQGYCGVVDNKCAVIWN